MKSLNEISEGTEHSPFTPEILNWIEKEGFKRSVNDSYCYSQEVTEIYNLKYEERAFFKRVESQKDEPIHVYIFNSGIGVDVDLDCGGNLRNRFFDFGSYTFEAAYDKTVDFVNKYR